MSKKIFLALFYGGLRGMKIPNTFNTVKTVKRICPPTLRGGQCYNIRADKEKSQRAGLIPLQADLLKFTRPTAARRN